MTIGKRFLVLCSLLLCFSSLAWGDIGPKDRLVIYVKHPPQEVYYLDLLTQQPGDYDNLREERDSLDSQTLELLSSQEKDGWYPALTGGTRIPMFGDLTGHPQGDTMVHTFSYFGLPQTYRILIVTQSGKTILSQPVTRQALQSSVTFDCETGELSSPPLAAAYFIQFLSTCLPTLLLEGIVLLLFGFSLKENWKPFLLINLATQILLTATLGAVLIRQGPMSAYFSQFPVELGILVVETLLYRKLLKGRSAGRRIGYGIAANLISWAAGFFCLGWQFELLVRFL